MPERIMLTPFSEVLTHNNMILKKLEKKKFQSDNDTTISRNLWKTTKAFLIGNLIFIQKLIIIISYY